jgi:hypothetical protein
MSKQKVKLVFARSYVENPTSNDCFSRSMEVELPSHISKAHLISAVAYHPKEYKPKSGYDFPGEDNQVATIWNFADENRLVGKLLTYIDATYSDKEQREAHKNIVKDVVYGYCQDLRTRASQTVEAHESDVE